VDSGPPPECKALVESTLPGVTIVFAASTKCVYTLAEAKAGITFDYELVIEDDVPDYVPQKYEYPEDVLAGLDVTGTVVGGTQRYCLCDLGLPHWGCPEMDGGFGYQTTCDPITLKKGRYAGSFTWQGENWTGPSDTLNPKGPQFPPGDYQLVVKTLPGSIEMPEGGAPPTIQVTATLPIRLTR
jgi:hypothetical protein